MNTSNNTDITNLAGSPTMAAAVEGLMAIPTCTTPGCDTATEPFTDRCQACLDGPQQGAQYVVLRVDDPRDLARLVDDLAAHPGWPLLTPVQEHPVNATAVATLRAVP